MEKTNVMRLLDQHKVPYQAFHRLESPPEGLSVYKTLVTQAKSGQHYVFVIPVEASLDLKKAAKASGEKAIHMIKEKELLPLTGYVHGGCSPLGMKKGFPTFFDQSASQKEVIVFSAGKVNYSVGLKLAHIQPMFKFQLADLVSSPVFDS
ncbi:TPA: aminoacyl-tRNA deacylase [Streptococcus suis]